MRFRAYLKQVFWPTNTSIANWHHLDITKASTPWVGGDTNPWPLTFTLMVDNFGDKSVNKNNVNHFISSIKKTYTLTKDWTGNLYCGINLEWDYIGQMVDISMPGYIKQNCRNLNISCPKHFKRVHTCQFGTEAQPPIPPTRHQHMMQKASNVCRKLWGAFYIMRGRSIWQS